MTKIKTYLFLAFFLSSAGFSQSPDQRFQDANRAYEANRFREARMLYEKILANGLASKELYFNYANACFKTQAIGTAILYYEKARRLDPNDEDIAANLLLVQSRLKDKIMTPPDFFLFQWSKSALYYFSVNGILMTVLIMLYGFTLFMMTAWILRWTTPLQDRLRRLMIILLVASVTLTVYRIIGENMRHEAIVITASVNVQADPMPEASVSCVIHEGTKVRIESVQDVWVEIRLPDGVTGWIPHQAVENI